MLAHCRDKNPFEIENLIKRGESVLPSHLKGISHESIVNAMNLNVQEIFH